MAGSKSDVLQGTLDLMVLKTLESMGSLHGYGIARRIEQVSGDTVTLNQGTIYPALLRLEQRGWVKAEWGISETGRRAKFYSLTRSGRKQIEQETENWERIAATMARFLAPSSIGFSSSSLGHGIHFEITLRRNTKGVGYTIKEGKHCRDIYSLCNLWLAPAMVTENLYVFRGRSVGGLCYLADVFEENSLRWGELSLVKFPLGNRLHRFFVCSLNPQEVCM